MAVCVVAIWGELSGEGVFGSDSLLEGNCSGRNFPGETVRRKVLSREDLSGGMYLGGIYRSPLAHPNIYIYIYIHVYIYICIYMLTFM